MFKARQRFAELRLTYAFIFIAGALDKVCVHYNERNPGSPPQSQALGTASPQLARGGAVVAANDGQSAAQHWLPDPPCHPRTGWLGQGAAELHEMVIWAPYQSRLDTQT